MMRIAILLNEKDVRLGRCSVQESTFIIQYGDEFFYRTTEGVRLTRDGVGIGVVFRQTEVYVRERLDP